MTTLKKEETLAAYWVGKLKLRPERFMEFWIGLTKNYDLTLCSGKVKSIQDDCFIYYLKFKDNSYICSRGNEFWESTTKPQ